MRSKISFFALTVCALMSTNAHAFVRHGARPDIQQKTISTTSSQGLQQYVGLRLVDGLHSAASSSDENIKFDNYMGIAAEYGIKYNEFRGEIEFKMTTESKHNENGYDSYYDSYYGYYGSYGYNYDLFVEYKNLMLNAYYDINIINNASIYLMGGLGIEHIDEKLKGTYDYLYVEDEDAVTGFVYQIGFGVSYMVVNNILFDLGYRYISAPEIDEDFTFSNHELLFGARYMF